MSMLQSQLDFKKQQLYKNERLTKTANDQSESSVVSEWRAKKTVRWNNLDVLRDRHRTPIGKKIYFGNL